MYKEIFMNFSFMSFSCSELNFKEMISLALKYGYTGIEPRINSGHSHGIETDSSKPFRTECKRVAQENGIEICCIATSCKYVDPEANQDQISETHKAIDLASDVGSPRIRVFGGKIPQSSSRESAVDLLAQSMLAVADHAEERHIAVCVETHDHWCNPEHLAMVMERVKHPAIGVNWDIMHPVRQANLTIDEAFNTLKPWIRHTHFHDGNVKENAQPILVPVGEGDIDHKRAVQLLKAAAYTGFMSGEWISWEPYESHLPRELATMKRYDRQFS